MMLEDVDDLLDELEAKESGDDSPAKRSVSRTASSSARTSTTEDLDDLLTDLEPPKTPFFGGAASAPPPRGDKAKKCWPPYLTGTTPAPAISPCDHLRCLKCDCSVVSFNGWLWQEDVDYLFLRTNYPEVEQLRSKLEPSRAGRAYACQCSSLGVLRPTPLNTVEGNTWVCLGK